MVEICIMFQDVNHLTTINDVKMICSVENTWCPDGFEYNSRSYACEPTEETCYNSGDEAYCNSIFGTDDTDKWEADSGCTRDDPEADYYTEACIPTTLDGIDYYFYQILCDIKAIGKVEKII